FMNKSELREKMLGRRNILTEEEVKEKSAQIVSKIIELKEYQNAKTIAVYIAKGSEVDLTRLILNAITNKEVLVPITNDHIEFYKFTTFGDLKPGRFGILEPEMRLKPTREPDLILIPGLAFDKHLHRLGYGKGYYDKYLKSSKAFKIGVGFEFQIVEKIPNDEHDVKLDLVLSEGKIVG
ncbi:5-formyltetrahydrofolate cyclo-ligase, partial [Candidatus Micrarchaeota archaeon]|nr:5-formyltetrahydrofolate cyclo-ligase [Candidatus Micrarchaeota archaeon]